MYVCMRHKARRVKMNVIATGVSQSPTHFHYERCCVVVVLVHEGCRVCGAGGGGNPLPHAGDL